MAIALDGSHTPGGASSASFGVDVTRSVTIGAGSDKCLIVVCSWQQDTTEPASCIWDPAGDNLSMTKIGPGTSPNFTGRRATAFRLTQAQGLTAKTANVVLRSGQDEFNAMIGTLSLTGVDQTTPTADFNSATGSSATPNVPVSNVAAGNWTINLSAPGGDGNITWTQGASGETEFVQQQNGPSGADCAGQYDSSTTGTVNMTHTMGSTDDWLSIGFRVIHSAGEAPLSVFLQEPIIGGSVFT